MHHGSGNPWEWRPVTDETIHHNDAEAADDSCRNNANILLWEGEPLNVEAKKNVMEGQRSFRAKNDWFK